jgi:hypothetical protein
MWNICRPGDPGPQTKSPLPYLRRLALRAGTD